MVSSARVRHGRQRPGPGPGPGTVWDMEAWAGSVRARSSARTRFWLEHNIRYTTRGLRLRVDDKCTYRVNRAHRVMGVKISALRVMIIMEGDMGDMLQHSKNILEIVQCGDLQLLRNIYACGTCRRLQEQLAGCLF